MTLRGVAFGNQVWLNVPVPSKHHDERDFARLQEMGMNSVRFYLNAITFEDPNQPSVYQEAGWAWLDQNVGWARQHGIYLVINMHFPPGGYQSLGKGSELWSNPEAQRRFIDLWVAIARRYRGEPMIAGYDLLNEPVVTQSIDQWRELAERTAQAIRAVDPEHILFVERVNGVGGDWAENDDRNFFRVQDPNVVYEFHFYKPLHFTHQNAFWVDFAPAELKYPDQSRAEVEWYQLKTEVGTVGSPKLPAGNSEWRYYEGQPYTVNDAKLAVAEPTLVCNANSGKAFFDDLLLEELDSAGNLVREIWRENLVSRRGWQWLQQEPGGVVQSEVEGHRDNQSVSLSATQAEASLSAGPWRIQTRVGATYKLSGWMKGQNIPPQATCQIRLSFASSKVPVQPRDRAFLAQELGAYVRWGKRERVPLYLGEWGAIRQAFEADRGGLRWAEDMLDLILENKLSFAFHDYHEENMGIYYGDDTLPDPTRANTALIELFRRKLRSGSEVSTRLAE